MGAATAGIEERVQFFYRWNQPDLAAAKRVETDDAVNMLRASRLRNVHPQMSVTWNSYPDRLGRPARMGGLLPP